MNNHVNPSHTPSRQASAQWLCFAVLGLGTLVSGLVSGCGRNSDTSAVANAGGADRADKTLQNASAESVLQRMIETYQQAESYSDRGRVIVRLMDNGKEIQDKADFRTVFQRPNKIRVQAYQTLLVSDGEHFKAQIRDPLTNDMDRQVLVQPAPKTLSQEFLYGDDILSQVIAHGGARFPAPVELLTSKTPFEGFLDKTAKRVLLTDDVLYNQRCFRVQIQRKDEKYVCWIDQKTHLLRRLELPHEVSNQHNAWPSGPQATTPVVSVVADFKNANLNQKPPADAFQLDIPSGARQVRFFVMPPEPLPTKLFGKHPGRFAFTNLEGDDVNDQSLRGRVCVLIWFTKDGICQPNLARVNEVRKQLKANPDWKDRLSFFAICAEDSSLSNQQVKRILTAWNVDLPVLRDLRSHGRDLFRIEKAPTLVILNEKGEVQVFQEQDNPYLQDELPHILKTLLTGENLAKLILEEDRRQTQAYEKLLSLAVSAATDPAQNGGQTSSEAHAAAKEDPKYVSLIPLWQNDQFKSAGNILAWPSGPQATTPSGPQATTRSKNGQASFVVMDGFRTVVELDSQGREVTRKELDLPPKIGVTYLRSFTPAGRAQGPAQGDVKQYFVASAFLSPQFHVFDQNWRRLWSYPPDNEKHDGLCNVQVFDLNRDGEPEFYAGFWRLVGVHAIDARGRKVWSNRTLPTVLSLAEWKGPNDSWPSGPQATTQLLALGGAGEMLPIQADGRHESVVRLPGRQFQLLESAVINQNTSSATRRIYCALDAGQDGALAAVGLIAGGRDGQPEKLREKWQIPLHGAQFANPISFADCCDFSSNEVPLWVVVSPAGAIHLVSDDGKWKDRFSLGQLPTGVKLTRIGEKLAILISTNRRVAAWEIRRPKTSR